MQKIKKFFCEILQNCKKPIAIFKKRVYNSIVVKRYTQNKKFEKNKKNFSKTYWQIQKNVLLYNHGKQRERKLLKTRESKHYENIKTNSKPYKQNGFR